jgi:glutamate-1-semialdehyde aminotransferase
MAAGIATLEILDQNEIDRINQLGEQLRDGLTRVLNSAGIKGRAGGFASTAFVYFFEHSFSNAKEAVMAAIPTLEFSQDVHLALLNQGVFPITRGTVAFIISTPMDEQTIEQIVARFEEALKITKPIADEML